MNAPATKNPWSKPLPGSPKEQALIEAIFSGDFFDPQKELLYRRMESPETTVKWLKKRYHQGYADYLKANRKQIEADLEDVGLSVDSKIGHFYLHFGAASFRGCYELSEVCEMKDLIEYATEELRLDEDYLPLTSIEGEGMTLFKKSTGQVFDVEFGQFELFGENKLSPVGETFLGFLQWAQLKDQKA